MQTVVVRELPHGLGGSASYQSAYQSTTIAWITYQLHSRHLSEEKRDNHMIWTATNIRKAVRTGKYNQVLWRICHTRSTYRAPAHKKTKFVRIKTRQEGAVHQAAGKKSNWAEASSDCPHSAPSRWDWPANFSASVNSTRLLARCLLAGDTRLLDGTVSRAFCPDICINVAALLLVEMIMSSMCRIHASEVLIWPAS